MESNVAWFETCAGDSVRMPAEQNTDRLALPPAQEGLSENPSSAGNTWRARLYRKDLESDLPVGRNGLERSISAYSSAIHLSIEVSPRTV